MRWKEKNAQGREYWCIKNWLEDQKGRNHLGDTGLGGSLLLKFILNKVWPGLFFIRIVTNGGSFKHADELLISQKEGKCWRAELLSAFQEELCFVLVGFNTLTKLFHHILECVFRFIF